MFNNSFSQLLEDSQKKLNDSMEELEETKRKVFSNIESRHNELNEALADLQRSINKKYEPVTAKVI